MTAARPRLHLVVTCASRKRIAVPSTLQLRQVTGARTGTRVQRWTQRLTDSAVQTVSAEDLYAGEHWDVARSLPDHASAFRHATLWVASAGWGLIPATATIRPYSATFTAGHPDSIPDGRRGCVAWWDAVTHWQGPAPGAPRSLAALVADNPRDRVLVALSQAYFAACTNDLTAAATAAADGQLTLIATGVRHPDFTNWQLAADARLQLLLGGTRSSLNARVTAHLLRAGLTDHDAMQRHLRRMLAKAPALPIFTRRRLTDAQIIRYIRQRRQRQPTVSRSRLLTELRQAGMACEQARFADLFNAAIGDST